jgi:hypothetical protein
MRTAGEGYRSSGTALSGEPQSLRIAGQAAVIELFVSVQGSWTMTSTNTQGLTCVIALGEAWQTAPKQLAGLNS